MAGAGFAPPRKLEGPEIAGTRTGRPVSLMAHHRHAPGYKDTVPTYVPPLIAPGKLNTRPRSLP